jgi:hypothetical protein
VCCRASTCPRPDDGVVRWAPASEVGNARKVAASPASAQAVASARGIGALDNGRIENASGGTKVERRRLTRVTRGGNDLCR